MGDLIELRAKIKASTDGKPDREPNIRLLFEVWLPEVEDIDPDATELAISYNGHLEADGWLDYDIIRTILAQALRMHATDWEEDDEEAETEEEG